MLDLEKDNLSAITFLIEETFVSSNSGYEPDGAADYGLAAGGAAYFYAPPLAIKSSTSAAITLLFGPVPITLEISMFFSLARFLAKGETKVLPPEDLATCC